MKKYSKKIITSFILLTSVLSASSTFASCPKTVSACNNEPGNIPAGATCSDYYIVTGGTPNTTTTYCTQCSVCVAGMNDCVKGALGCNKCNISNGTTTYHGIACAGSPNACAPGNTNFSCTS